MMDGWKPLFLDWQLEENFQPFTHDMRTKVHIGKQPIAHVVISRTLKQCSVDDIPGIIRVLSLANQFLVSDLLFVKNGNPLMQFNFSLIASL